TREARASRGRTQQPGHQEDPMTKPAPFLTAAALTPAALAARHKAVLRRGAQVAAQLRTRPEPPRLAELVALLPQLTIDAWLAPLLPSGRRTLQAAGLWIADAALARESPTDAPVVRARAAAIARAQLADALTHPHADSHGALVRRL